MQQLKLLLNKTQLKFQFNQAKKKITKASRGRKTSSSFMVLVKGQRIQMDGTHVRTVRVNKKYPPAKRRVIKVVSASGFNFALTTDHFQQKKTFLTAEYPSFVVYPLFHLIKIIVCHNYVPF